MSFDYGSALWYLSRATGIVSLFLLTFTLALGVAVHRGARPSRVPAFAMSQIHRNASLLAVAFLVVHVAGVVIDPYVQLRWVDAVVPFVSEYQPFWLGLGTLAVDLLIAITITGLLRSRMNKKLWKAVHVTAYALFPLALVHGLGAGTDLSSGIALLAALGCAVAFALVVWWRTTEPPQRRRPAHRRPAPQRESRDLVGAQPRRLAP